MRRKNSQKETLKTCPLLDEKCLKAGCEIYNELLGRCDINLIPYNMFKLTEVMKQQIDAAS